MLDYFWNHKLFYRTDNSETLILNAREGWRTIDTFYPFEVMRVGLQNIVESFCALGYGKDDRLREAWDLLQQKRDAIGKYLLDQTLTKSYLPKERVGKSSKWVTFYAMLAQGKSESNGCVIKTDKLCSLFSLENRKCNLLTRDKFVAFHQFSVDDAEHSPSIDKRNFVGRWFLFCPKVQ